MGLVGRWFRVVARERHAGGERGGRPPEEYAPRRGNIGVVPADRHPNVAVVAAAVVGGVDADPPLFGEPALHPGVALSRSGVPRAGREVSRDVARGNPPAPGDRRHHVCVVLADAPPGLQDAVDGRIRRGGARCVLEDAEEAGRHPEQAAHAVVLLPDPVCAEERGQGGGAGPDESTRLEHQLQLRRVRFARLGLRRGRGQLDERSREDAELRVGPVATEEVTPIAEAVHELRHRARRIGLQLEALQRLPPPLPRANEDSHHGPPHGRFVPVRQLVLHAVDHRHDGRPSSTG